MMTDEVNHVHGRATFHSQLQKLLDDLTVMGSMADAAISDAMRSLKNRNHSLAALVVSADANINHLRFKVEDTCLHLIAQQQPNAGDLRLIVAALTIALELERIGDHAASIASRVLHLAENPLRQPVGALTSMSDMVREMLRESLDALLENDAEAALAVAKKDAQIDQAYEVLFLDVVARIAEQAEDPTDATYLLFCGHNLERIGDRITNICERIIFVVTGRLQEMEAEENEQQSVAPA
jgi:phosphate transport system protein